MHLNLIKILYCIYRNANSVKKAPNCAFHYALLCFTDRALNERNFLSLPLTLSLSLPFTPFPCSKAAFTWVVNERTQSGLTFAPFLSLPPLFSPLSLFGQITQTCHFSPRRWNSFLELGLVGNLLQICTLLVHSSSSCRNHWPAIKSDYATKGHFFCKCSTKHPHPSFKSLFLALSLYRGHRPWSYTSVNWLIIWGTSHSIKAVFLLPIMPDLSTRV